MGVVAQCILFIPIPTIIGSKSTALTVKNMPEYVELVSKIEDKKLSTIYVLVDMADIEAKCKKMSCSYAYYQTGKRGL